MGEWEKGRRGEWENRGLRGENGRRGEWERRMRGESKPCYSVKNSV